VISFGFKFAYIVAAIYVVIVTFHNLNKQVLWKAGRVHHMEFHVVWNEKTWLSDVKGIDEITDEIQNLIK